MVVLPRLPSAVQLPFRFICIASCWDVISEAESSFDFCSIWPPALSSMAFSCSLVLMVGFQPTTDALTRQVVGVFWKKTCERFPALSGSSSQTTCTAAGIGVIKASHCQILIVPWLNLRGMLKRSAALPVYSTSSSTAIAGWSTSVILYIIGAVPLSTTCGWTGLEMVAPWVKVPRPTPQPPGNSYNNAWYYYYYFIFYFFLL